MQNVSFWINSQQILQTAEFLIINSAESIVCCHGYDSGSDIPPDKEIIFFYLSRGQDKIKFEVIEVQNVITVRLGK